MLEMFNVLEETLSSNTTICGGIAIPNEIFNLVATIIRAFKIVVPILLIIWGMLDFAKSIIAKKEEDIKKYRSAFVGRLISAVLVFLVIVIVQFVVNIIDGVETKSANGDTVGDVWSCSKKFINGVDVSDDTEETTNETDTVTSDNDNNTQNE